MGKISIQEIAKLAGVSKTTVSAVLNNRGDQYGISPETQRKIRDIAQKFHYTPDNMARGLRLKKTQTIGIVVPDLSNWFFSQLCESLQKVVKSAGYRLYITSSNYNEKQERSTINDLLAWNVDGLIVASMMRKEQIPQNFLNNQTPVIYVDRRIESKNISWVASDNFQGSYELINYMCSTGVQEICYLGGERIISTFQNRFEGYRRAIEDHDIHFNPDLVFESGFTASDGYQLMKTMLKRRNGFPEAIFAASCDFMIGLLQFIKDEVDEIPSTLHIGTYDNHSLLDFLSVKIPSVQQDTHRMALAAFTLIQKAINGEGDVKHQIIPPQLIIR
jgi:LacI family sucrose operon transcriptional repressor